MKPTNNVDVGIYKRYTKDIYLSKKQYGDLLQDSNKKI